MANGKGAASPHEAETLALQALGWVLADERRADRLLALTGLDAETLRGALGERATLAAILSFVADHERDLLDCADAIGVAPETLVQARETLAR